MALLDLHYRRAQPRPHNMKLWLGRLETPAPQPQKQPIAPPAPKAKGAKGAAAQFAAAMRGLLGHDWDVPPPPSYMGLDPIVQGNRKYWASDPEPA